MVCSASTLRLSGSFLRASPGWAVVCGLSLALLFHCNVPAKDAPNEKPVGPCVGCQTDGGKDALAQEVGVDAQPAVDTRNALCGPMGCNPDDAVAVCETGLAGQGGAAAAGTGKACHVVKAATGSPAAACVISGAAMAQDPCQAQSDCAAGFACVGSLGDPAGKCRPYCCYGQDACGPGTYCTLVRSFEVIAGIDALRVPACMVASNCRLLDSGACDPGLACAVVDGATTCLPPGNGSDDAPCPCAAGYVCLRSTATCRRICHQRADQECGGGTCVSGGAAVPEGFGVCSR